MAGPDVQAAFPRVAVWARRSWRASVQACRSTRGSAATLTGVCDYCLRRLAGGVDGDGNVLRDARVVSCCGPRRPPRLLCHGHRLTAAVGFGAFAAGALWLPSLDTGVEQWNSGARSLGMGL